MDLFPMGESTAEKYEPIDETRARNELTAFIYSVILSAGKKEMTFDELQKQFQRLGRSMNDMFREANVVCPLDLNDHPRCQFVVFDSPLESFKFRVKPPVSETGAFMSKTIFEENTRASTMMSQLIGFRGEEQKKKTDRKPQDLIGKLNLPVFVSHHDSRPVPARNAEIEDFYSKPVEARAPLPFFGLPKFTIDRPPEDAPSKNFQASKLLLSSSDTEQSFSPVSEKPRKIKQPTAINTTSNKVHEPPQVKKIQPSEVKKGGATKTNRKKAVQELCEIVEESPGIRLSLLRLKFEEIVVGEKLSVSKAQRIFGFRPANFRELIESLGFFKLGSDGRHLIVHMDDEYLSTGDDEDESWEG